MNSLESDFQPTKKQLNDWIAKVWVLLQTTVTGRKINSFLLMTHISPLWWSKAMGYIYMHIYFLFFFPFLPYACHGAAFLIASFVVKNVTLFIHPPPHRIFKTKCRKSGIYLSFRPARTKVDRKYIPSLKRLPCWFCLSENGKFCS